jgi:HlyD family secretion protein
MSVNMKVNTKVNMNVNLRVVAAIGATLLLGCSDEDASRVEGTGTLEVVEVDVSALTPARVVRVWREEGDTVRAGDTLVSLTQSTVQADVSASRSRVEAAEAQLRDLEAGARPAELENAEAAVRAAESEATRTAQDLERLSTLLRTGGVSEQEVDAARTAATVTAAQRDQARDQLRLLREGARPQQVAGARAEVATARAALAAARQTASDLVLTAPVGGVVMLRNAEPGEVLGAGVSAMTIGELGAPYARIFVNQRALPGIALGARVEGVLDGRPQTPFAGTVVAINNKAEFTPRVALTEEERADLLFGVKVAFRDSAGALKPGLPITVRIVARQ